MLVDCDELKRELLKSLKNFVTFLALNVTIIIEGRFVFEVLIARG